MSAVVTRPVPKCRAPQWQPGETECEFDLGETHSYCERHAYYHAPTGTLVIARTNRGRRKPTKQIYTLREFQTDWDGRAFTCGRVFGESHQLMLGEDGITCSCRGTESLANAKANQRAWEDGSDIFPSYGCAHLDAVAALIAGGWL